MEFTMLGRTGLRVSRMGLGCGGPSRLGMRAGGSEGNAERVVREALELGIKFIDTADAYGTEEVVGPAIHGPAREQIALHDSCWDVIMVGFNMLNQSARERVLAVTRRDRIGTLCMFAVRRALSQPDALKKLMADLTEQNLVDAGSFDPDDPLGFLFAD